MNKLLFVFLVMSAISCGIKNENTKLASNQNNNYVTKGVGLTTINHKPPEVKIAGLPIINSVIAPSPTIFPIANKEHGLPHFKNYTTDNGLALDAVSCSVTDKKGNLWFGTSGGGVSRFDGNLFTNYTTAQGIPNNTIWSIAEDKKGNLWFGTEGGGVCKYNGNTFINYSTSQGLANNGVLSILEDRKGNLWFGTYGGGVSKFDGKNFTNYTTKQGLVNNKVRCIIEDKVGNLWFGTYGGGLSKFDGKNFTTYSSNQGIAENVILCVFEDKSGNIWFGTENGGVSMYEGNNTISSCDKNNCKHDLQKFEDKNNHNIELSKLITNYTPIHGLAHKTIWCITEDNMGNIWFGSSGGGVSKYDASKKNHPCNKKTCSHNLRIQESLKEHNNVLSKSFNNFTTEHGLANNVVLSVTKDKTGNLWFGTEGGGVSRYDGNSFTKYTTKQGLANNAVLSILEDKYKNLWFGTYGGGVSKYNGKFFTNYTTTQGFADNVVLSILEDKIGNIWFGTYGGGVCKYDGNRVDAIERGEKTAQQTPQDLKKVNGKLVKSFTNYTSLHGLPNNVIWSIAEDNNGNLWFATERGGISKFDGTSFTNYSTEQGLANNVVLCILKDKKGNLWIGTENGGVSKFDGKSFTNYTTAHGLANNGVISITEDKNGNLWFGTDGGGVSRFDGETFLNYSTAHGLTDNVVTQVVADRKNSNIVVATNFGIGVIKGFRSNNKSDANVNNISSKNTSILQLEDSTEGFIEAQNKFYNKKISAHSLVIEKYNSASGFPIKDVNTGQNCMMQDSKGIYWAGTGSDVTALVRIDFNALNRNPNAPTIVIKNIKLNETDICWYSCSSVLKLKGTAFDSTTISQQEIMSYGKILNHKEREEIQQKYSGIKFDDITKFYSLPQNLVLPYEHNNISFEFNAIEPSKPFLINYQYMLDGYDRNWSPVLQKTSASFGNISEGSYTFKLKAQYTGSDGNNTWSQPIIYKFKVLPPWYRTWWMYSIYTALIVSIIYFLIWFNGRKLKIRALELTDEVRKATIEIRNEKEISDSQRVFAEKQKCIVEEKQKEILDSIHYAKRIQTALLTSEELFATVLAASNTNYYASNTKNDNQRDYFILFKPKDIVSGDFYWAMQLKNKFYIATCDCTGHGVPGAFMSMLNISLLNEVILVSGITEPHEILNQVRNEIIRVLNPKGSKEESMDGMDAVLCCFDFDAMQLNFAAANNPLWLLRDGIITEYKPDKIPVGKYSDENKSFTLQTIELRKNDIIYTITDGYADQFGGPFGKKFKYKTLMEGLIANCDKSMKEQKDLLSIAFDNWKGSAEQVDDVCVIGIKI